MRLRFWLTQDATGALDPELESIFASGSHSPALDSSRVAGGRLRVAAQLREEPVAGGWFGQRLAYGFVGGGGLWASLAGTAAAHKAATAVGVGVLLAGGATAEISGIGPAVREAVSPVHSSSDPLAETDELLTDEQKGTAASSTEGSGAGTVVGDSPDDLPGNLTTQVRPNGGFTLRGVLVAATNDEIDVQTSVDDAPLTFEIGTAELRVPGPTSEPEDLDDFEGHLVVITGTCETVDRLLTEDCELARVTVLGNAGKGGPDDGAGRPNDPGQGVGPPGGTEQSEGPPEHANPSAKSDQDDDGPDED